MTGSRQKTLRILQDFPAANFMHPKGCFFTRRGEEAVLKALDAIANRYDLYDPDKDSLIASYESASEMVDAGWRLGS